MNAIGLKLNQWSKDGLRICQSHELTTVKKTKLINRQSRSNKIKKQQFSFSFVVPIARGVRHVQNIPLDTGRRSSTAKDRRHLKNIDADRTALMVKCDNNETAVEMIIERNNMIMQKFERETPAKKKRCIAPIVAKQYGITPNDNNNAPSPPPARSKQTRHFNRNVEKILTSEAQPAVVAVEKLSEKEVKRRTGFHGGVKALLRFIITVCNGDFDMMKSTASTYLTWFEEWFIYLEVVNGKTWTRWEDLLSKNMFDVAESAFHKIIDSKLNLIKRCRTSWPRYASHEEDLFLRDNKWNEKYGNKRCIMLDDTNGPFTFKPSIAMNQRSTWSSYYGSNCAKGGVFLQYCGWMGVSEYYGGAISDSLYVEKTGILKEQQKFAEDDLVNGEYIPFTNILDKGYRIIRLAWEAGRQTVVQPAFAASDRQFHTNEMLESASVAADRSGNERAVKNSKASGFIKRGLKPNASPARFNNVWLAWSFQANFMFAAVV
jgi:hypothetical protein